MTLWYFVYDLPSRHDAVLRRGPSSRPSWSRPASPEPVPLWLRGPAIGMLPSGNWAVARAEMPPGSRLYVFSDGAFEIDRRRRAAMGASRICGRIVAGAGAGPGLSEAQRLYQAVRAAARPGPLDDDFSVLVVRFE